jgi:hypothetical protein
VITELRKKHTAQNARVHNKTTSSTAKTAVAHCYEDFRLADLSAAVFAAVVKQPWEPLVLTQLERPNRRLEMMKYLPGDSPNQKAKMRFQSSFMLITVQPSFFASS